MAGKLRITEPKVTVWTARPGALVSQLQAQAEASSGCPKSLEARIRLADPFGVKIMYQNSEMHLLCFWLKVKAAKPSRPGCIQTDSACRLVTVSFPRQALPLAEGHKDPIVIWPLVPWAEWPLTRAKPNKRRMKFHCSTPPHSQHSH